MAYQTKGGFQMLSKDDTYRKIFANNLNYYMQVNNKIQDDLVKDLK